MKTTRPAAYRLALRPLLAEAFVLVLPLVAMQVTDQVAWTPADFAFAGVLVVGTGLAYELAARRAEATAYRLAAGVALAAGFLLVWVNGAVGIIGAAGDGANLMYAGVLAVGVVGAVVARFRPRGMSRVLFATAVAQAVVALIALIAGMGSPASGPAEILVLNGFFVALFLGSALLFGRAAREESGAKARPVG